MTQPALRLSEDEQRVMGRLCSLHDEEKTELEEYDRLYEGTQRARYMAEDVFRESSDRIPEVRIFWPQTAVDAIAERLFLQGIRSGDDDLDAEFKRVWTANEMDLGLAEVIIDALVMRRGYISVGTNEDDPETPIVAPESPLELYVRYDPRTRKPVEALKRWCVYDLSGTLSEEYATLYLPDSTIWLEQKSSWVVTNRDDHKLGEVPIATLMNRPRTSSAMNTARGGRRERIGRSDIESIRTLTWLGNKAATDMGVASERVAIPLRAIFGAGPEEFKDEKGNPMTPMQALMGGLLAIPQENITAFEFAAAQLSNFTGEIREISQQVGMSTGLPPHYLGTPSDNPASAEAITGSESRLATRAEYKQLPFSAGVRRTARLMNRFATGSWEDKLRWAKADWRDVRTPTVGARADAAVKLGPKDKPILPLRQVRQELGYDDAAIEEMEAEDEKAAEKMPSRQIMAAAMADNGMPRQSPVTGANPSAA